MAKRTSAGLTALSIADLRREMERRQRGVGKLVRKRDALLAKAAKLDAQIAELAGQSTPARAGRTRGGGRSVAARTRKANEGGLSAALHKVLNGKTMGVTEAAKAVVAAGYKTGADNFRTIVNACLLKHKNLFRKVSRGRYTAA
ncbi:MAG: hypothetical protein IT433_02515 [Phycisphaerales bacterium]|nr:hypothetical protein [Phycisphaerales bacterium]